MKKINVAINGMGRIGRTLLREYFRRNDSSFNLVAINSIGDLEEIANLIEFDSIHGKLNFKLSCNKETVTIRDRVISFSNHNDISKITWDRNSVNLVIDCTGRHKNREQLEKYFHIRSVKKVILSSPGVNLDYTFVLGINHHDYEPRNHNLVSNASCTTNCIAPILRLIHSRYLINSGFFSTVHSYTSDQNLLDAAHSDLRRGRAAALSIIPTTTNATSTLFEVIPDLKGKIKGNSYRVPTPNVSLADFTLNVKEVPNKDEIIRIFQQASRSYLKGILRYEERELVSSDFIGDTHSAIIDSNLISINDHTIKLVAWYDNEIGYSNRILDLINYIQQKGI